MLSFDAGMTLVVPLPDEAAEFMHTTKITVLLTNERNESIMIEMSVVKEDVAKDRTVN